MPFVLAYAGWITTGLLVFGGLVGALTSRWVRNRPFRRAHRDWLEAHGDADSVLGPGHRTVRGKLRIEGASRIVSPPSPEEMEPSGVRLQVGDAEVELIGVLDVAVGRIAEVRGEGVRQVLRAGDLVIARGTLQQGSRDGAYRGQGAAWILDGDRGRVELGSGFGPRVVRPPMARALVTGGGMALGVALVGAVIAGVGAAAGASWSEVAEPSVEDAEGVLPWRALDPLARESARFDFARTLHARGERSDAAAVLDEVYGCGEALLYRASIMDVDGVVDREGTCALSPAQHRALGHFYFGLGRMREASDHFASAPGAAPARSRLGTDAEAPAPTAADAARAHLLAGRLELAAQEAEGLEVSSCLVGGVRALAGGPVPTERSDRWCALLTFLMNPDMRDRIREDTVLGRAPWGRDDAGSEGDLTWSWFHLMERRLAAVRPSSRGAAEAARTLRGAPSGACRVPPMAAPGLERIASQGLRRGAHVSDANPFDDEDRQIAGVLAVRRASLEASVGNDAEARAWRAIALEHGVEPTQVRVLATHSSARAPERVATVGDALCVAASRKDRDGARHAQALLAAWDHPERSFLLYLLDRSVQPQREAENVPLQWVTRRASPPATRRYDDRRDRRPSCMRPQRRNIVLVE